MLKVKFLFCRKGKTPCVAKNIYLTYLTLVVMNIILLSGLGLAEPNSVKLELPKLPSALTSSSPNDVNSAFGLIYHGKFDAAGELIKKHDPNKQPEVAKLVEIISEYQAINQKRQLARESDYKEQLAELEKLQAKANTKDVNTKDVNTKDVNNKDVNNKDVNDVNDITKILEVVAKASEYTADEQQKNELLSKPFVKQTFEKAIKKATEFELKGQWLEACIDCYWWLEAIDLNNKAYSEYADELVKKAEIVASFQDSPCETCKERYSGIEEQMFVRAIKELDFSYVSIIDYRQMANKAVKQCELLADVLKTSFSRDSKNEISTWFSQGSYSVPDSKVLAAWSAALKGILDEVNQSATGISREQFIDIYRRVLILNATTIKLPEQLLIVQFTEGAMLSLDPYTIMVWPKQVEEFERSLMTSDFTGIGVEISKDKGLLTIASLLPDTPAYNSGLDAGDVIEKVDEVPTKDMTLACVVRKITGPAGTKVTLTIKRPGGEVTHDITIKRGKIVVSTIRGWKRTKTGKWLYMIDEENKIGFVRITNFSESTAADLEKALLELEAEGMKGLILDLRLNSGGLLDSAIEVTDKFVSEGLIVSTRPLRQPWTRAWAHKRGTHPNYPLVILINRFSASASEIVAGVLQDPKHNRAILVGERTYGKGSVQGMTTYPGGGAQLKYTMAYYHLPSGQRVESREAVEKECRRDWGVGPNVEVKLINDEMKKLSEIQRDNDVLVKATHDNCNRPLKKYTAHEALETDPQLAVGVLVIKSKLIQAKLAGSEAK